MECLNCGKPLGNRTGLCYACQSAGVEPASQLSAPDDIVDRLERYFIVASSKCADCGDIHGTVTVGEEEYTAADFGIESVEEWELEMDKEEAWIRDNRDAVEQALTELEDEWPASVAAVKTHVL